MLHEFIFGLESSFLLFGFFFSGCGGTIQLRHVLMKSLSGMVVPQVKEVCLETYKISQANVIFIEKGVRRLISEDYFLSISRWLEIIKDS